MFDSIIWKRFVARCIDMVILVIVFQTVFVLVQSLFQLGSSDLLTRKFSAIFLIGSYFYFVIFTYLFSGKTLGKMIVKIKVVSLKNTLSVSQVAIRFAIIEGIINVLPLVISFVFPSNIVNISFILIIGAVSLGMILDKNNRAVHDIYAHTRVIRS